MRSWTELCSSGQPASLSLHSGARQGGAHSSPRHSAHLLQAELGAHAVQYLLGGALAAAGLQAQGAQRRPILGARCKPVLARGPPAPRLMPARRRPGADPLVPLALSNVQASLSPPTSSTAAANSRCSSSVQLSRPSSAIACLLCSSRRVQPKDCLPAGHAGPQGAPSAWLRCRGEQTAGWAAARPPPGGRHRELPGAALKTPESYARVTLQTLATLSLKSHTHSRRAQSRRVRVHTAEVGRPRAHQLTARCAVHPPLLGLVGRGRSAGRLSSTEYGVPPGQK